MAWAVWLDKQKPGIRGWAQINERDEIPLGLRWRWRKSIWNASDGFDLMIMFKTFTSVLFSKGMAY